MRIGVLTGVVALSLYLIQAPASAAIQAGDILISHPSALHGDRVVVLSSTGVFKEAIAIPEPHIPGGLNFDDVPRDLVIDSQGNIQLFHDTPELYTYDMDAGTWSSRMFPGWYMVNNVRYGGIAALGDYVFLADQNSGLANSDPSQGVIRLNVVTGAYEHFSGAGYASFADLAVGLDGLLYAAPKSGAGAFIRVYDPLSMQLLRSVSLVRTGEGLIIPDSGIAADAFGNIYYGTRYFIYKFGPDGQEITRIETSVKAHVQSTGSTGIYDLNILPTGQLLATGGMSKLVLTDTSLTADQVIEMEAGGFSAFAAPPMIIPEPGTAFAVGLASLGLLAARRPRRT